MLTEGQWLEIGRKYNVLLTESKWKFAKTEVYEKMYKMMHNCKDNSISTTVADLWGIGKSECGKHILKGMKDAYYVDCSLANTKQKFIRTLASTVGVDSTGRFFDVRDKLIYYLNLIEKPIIFLDDAGDLDYPAFLALKALWNATEGNCSWLMVGDDSLSSKIDKGINNKKVGYGAVFSRFSEGYFTIVPQGRDDRVRFFQKLLGDVAFVNVNDKSTVNMLVNQCMGTMASATTSTNKKGKKAATDNPKLLRHLKTLILAGNY